jgi:hypothetical protein
VTTGVSLILSEEFVNSHKKDPLWQLILRSLDHLRGKFSIVEDHMRFIINTNQENIYDKMEVDEEGRDAKEDTAINTI